MNKTRVDTRGAKYLENLRRLEQLSLFETPFGGNGFQHLYGNVQEWVYDDPDSVTPAEGEPILSPREILDNIKITSLGVIGGSALSSTLYPPYALQNVEKPAIPEDLLKMTYSDVGFRLVIAGKFDTVAQQVLAATSRGYVNLN